MELFIAILTILVVSAPVVWFILRTIRRAEDPKVMIVKWILTVPVSLLCLFSVSIFGALGPFVIVFCAIIISIIWTPHLAAGMAKPITSLFDGGTDEPDPHPLYSVAQAKQKRGRYLEAIADIRAQLEKFPTDLEGLLLLAQIQAEDLKDLPGAELTIQKLVEQPGHAPKNLAFALYSMADWQLSIGRDREAARRHLQAIVDRFPGSEFALGAAQRIAHLGTDEMMLDPLDRKKFTVTEGPKDLGLRAARNREQVAAQENPAKAAADLVKHLEQHPQDTEARENLATIYADHYARLDLAVDQLEQMISQPNQPGKLVVHWLNRMADLQIRCGADYETVKATLERIIEQYPDLAAAEIARNRLSLLKLEMRPKTQSETVKLGSYEDRIGLKQGSPFRKL